MKRSTKKTILYPNRAPCLSQKLCWALKELAGRNGTKPCEKAEVKEIREAAMLYGFSPSIVQFLVEAGCIYVDANVLEKLTGLRNS